MASRYSQNSSSPQPIRKIIPALTDISHPFKMGERLDNLATKYYQDPLESYIIMCGNPEYDNEFEIPFNTFIRIPFPLQRVYDQWLLEDQI